MKGLICNCIAFVLHYLHKEASYLPIQLFLKATIQLGY